MICKPEKDGDCSIVPDRFAYLLKMGDCYLFLENYSKADDFYHRALEVNDKSSESYAGLGMLAFNQGRINQARDAFNTAVQLDSECARAYLGLAMIAQHDFQLAEAVDLYSKSLELDPSSMPALLGLFRVCRDAGSYERVIGKFETYLNSNDFDSRIMFALATLYVMGNLFEKARSVLEKLLQKEPANQKAVLLLEEIDNVFARVVVNS